MNDSPTDSSDVAEKPPRTRRNATPKKTKKETPVLSDTGTQSAQQDTPARQETEQTTPQSPRPRKSSRPKKNDVSAAGKAAQRRNTKAKRVPDAPVPEIPAPAQEILVSEENKAEPAPADSNPAQEMVEIQQEPSEPEKVTENIDVVSDNAPAPSLTYDTQVPDTETADKLPDESAGQKISSKKTSGKKP
jgi:hypothetical protein